MTAPMKHTPIGEALRERVARALQAKFESVEDPDGPTSWEDSDREVQDAWRAMADAALSEIRAFLEEPTEEVIYVLRVHCGDSAQECVRMWQQALRTAIAESEKPKK